MTVVAARVGAVVCGAIAGALAIATPVANAGDAAAPVAVTFPSEDELEITADLYLAHEDAKTPLIVLFHQAGWSRGEYREIAPRLNELGYNCIAVDQRSGGRVNGVRNETARRAEAKRLAHDYVAALPDIRAALRWARAHHAKGTMIAWGSSYSASLVLVVAGTHPELVDAVVAFSPGEYFGKLGKSRTWVRDSAASIAAPVFITSAKSEHDAWKSILAAIPKVPKVGYRPKTAGNHGSRALYRRFDDSDAYWNAVTAFLRDHAR